MLNSSEITALSPTADIYQNSMRGLSRFSFNYFIRFATQKISSTLLFPLLRESLWRNISFTDGFPSKRVHVVIVQTIMYDHMSSTDAVSFCLQNMLMYSRNICTFNLDNGIKEGPRRLYHQKLFNPMMIYLSGVRYRINAGSWPIRLTRSAYDRSVVPVLWAWHLIRSLWVMRVHK